MVQPATKSGGVPIELLSIVVDEKISNPSFFSRGLFLEDSIFTKHTLNNPGD